MAHGSGGTDQEGSPEPVHGHGQREDSSAATTAGAPSSVAPEGRAGASSPLPPYAPPSGEQSGGGGGDARDSTSATAGADVAATSSPGRRNDEQGESSRARKTLSKILNSGKNKFLCRKGFDQSSTGSLSKNISKGPHVAQQKFPFNEALSHYEEQLWMIHRVTGAMATNLLKLRETYSQFRTVEGDGECFYRSFIFSYLEQVLDRQDTIEERRLLTAVSEVAREDWLLRDVKEVAIARLGWTSNFLRSYLAFKNLVEKVMSWKTRGSLNLVASTDSYKMQELLSFFSTYDKTEDIFVFLRSAAAIRICSDREEYEQHIRELGQHCSAQEWCIQHVTPPRAVAEDVEIRALATTLGVPLSVRRLGAGAGLDINPGVSPVHVTVLNTDDHYDIIYPKSLSREVIDQSSTESLSYEFSNKPHVYHKARRPSLIKKLRQSSSRTRRARDSIDISCRPRRRPQPRMIDWQSILRELPEE